MTRKVIRCQLVALCRVGVFTEAKAGKFRGNVFFGLCASQPIVSRSSAHVRVNYLAFIFALADALVCLDTKESKMLICVLDSTICHKILCTFLEDENPI